MCAPPRKWLARLRPGMPGHIAPITRMAPGFENHFFFQAEDGIRDYKVTGVQTCALPISARGRRVAAKRTHAASGEQVRLPQAGCRRGHRAARSGTDLSGCLTTSIRALPLSRSEERRVGKEGRSRWSPYH